MFIDDKDKENDAWKFLFRKMSVFYLTVDELCDIEHETKDESPDNFFIEFCVQWFLSRGGGDPIFGCQFSFDFLQSTCYSVGRR